MITGFEIPAHVPPELVIDFDFGKVPGATEDAHLAWKKLHDGPDIVWTPHYGFRDQAGNSSGYGDRAREWRSESAADMEILT